ncbi:MAG: biopolymer transporter ExbD [Pseudomonadota bacterium]
MNVSFSQEGTQRRGHVGLTPMVDVVFLLLVFFMLAASYGEEASAIRLAPAGGDGAEADAQVLYEGEPRLVSITPDRIRLNGFVTPLEDLPAALEALMPTPDAVVVLRTVDGADLQRLVAVMDQLRAAGITGFVLAE